MLVTHVLWITKLVSYLLIISITVLVSGFFVLYLSVHPTDFLIKQKMQKVGTSAEICTKVQRQRSITLHALRIVK